MRTWAAAVLSCLIAGFLVAEEPTDTFRSDIARIEVTKPSGWRYQSLQAAIENRAQVKTKEQEFGEAMRRMATTPLFVATKHEEPYDSLNPSIQLLARPAGPLEGQRAEAILELVAPALEQQFEDFSMQGEIETVSVAGQEAARMTMTYTLVTQDGREFPTKATIVVIPKGPVLYQLGFSGPPTGDDAIEGEVDHVLASVSFLE